MLGGGGWVAGMKRESHRCLLARSAVAGSLGCLCLLIGGSADPGRHPASAYPPALALTREGIASIRPGMEWEQVVAILGGPPGDYRKTAAWPDLDSAEWRDQMAAFDNIQVDIDVLLGRQWY